MSNGGGSYEPAKIEQEIEAFWDAGDYFRATADASRKPFSIVIPPPNVTGALHLGHALNNTLQDILIRRKRMQGYNACWLPGTDHAGIATQAVVEKRLKKEENLTRHQLGRAGLVERIQAWKDEYEGRILGQLRRMGCSCDWSRTRFTLDEGCAKAVYETFFRLFRDGLIYRGKRLVNWDCELQTAVADDELYHETVKGHMWHFRYPVLPLPRRAEGLGQTEIPVSSRLVRHYQSRQPNQQEGERYLVIATTRPETMLADVAVAVHPDDKRYQHLIGEYVLLPLVDRAIPVIADGLLVRQDFGSGCVKVTPGHDPNDYACAIRHGMDPAKMPNMMTPDGKIAADYPPYSGMPRAEARKKIVADLEALGLVERIEDYETDVGHSDRSKTPIEPLLSEQWFLKMDKLAELAMEAVRDGRVQFFPERYAKTYLDWLGEKRDWCISRQLWWGHRIPVWTIYLNVGSGNASEPATKQQEMFAKSKTELASFFDSAGIDAADYVLDPIGTWAWRVCPRTSRGRELLDALGPFLQSFNLHRQGSGAPVSSQPEDWPQFPSCFSSASKLWDLVLTPIRHDEDVLDTWFSSALWPHSTFGWPNGEADLDYFYPTSVLSTARDIITLWVARMVITGLYNTGRVPFPHVCIHPTIQDGHGRRMSKSAGNGVDPLDLIEIYGADAMRYTLASLLGDTQDIRIPVKPLKLDDGRVVNTSDRFELGRNFCNKLWQASTGFVLPNLTPAPPGGPVSRERLALEDRWILSRLSACAAEVDRRIDRYQISDAASGLYAFFWNDFCDWYVELVKPRLSKRSDAGETTPRTDESAATARRVLGFVLDTTLRLLHPIAPFITEKLWRMLGEGMADRSLDGAGGEGAALIVSAWPRAEEIPHDETADADMAMLQEVIRALRDVRAQVNAIRAVGKQPAVRALPSAFVKADTSRSARLRAHATVIQRLGQCELLEIGPSIGKPAESATKVLTGVEVYVPLKGLADLGLERVRLTKERDELSGHIGRLEAKLANEAFVGKAPPTVIERERARLAELTEKRKAVERNLADLEG